MTWILNGFLFYAWCAAVAIPLIYLSPFFFSFWNSFFIENCLFGSCVALCCVACASASFPLIFFLSLRAPLSLVFVHSCLCLPFLSGGRVVFGVVFVCLDLLTAKYCCCCCCCDTKSNVSCSMFVLFSSAVCSWSFCWGSLGGILLCGEMGCADGGRETEGEVREEGR